MTRPVIRRLFGGAIAWLLVACGSTVPAAPLPLTATDAPFATESPLIVEETTPKPAASRNAGDGGIPSGDYYKPSGWKGGDVNCGDFDTHAHAQSFFKGTGGSKQFDDYGLDGDHDGVACENLP